MNFKDFNWKINEQVDIIKVKDKEIHIKNYLPISDKIDIIEIALQNAKEEDGLYNEIKLEVFFNLNIVYSYTDLVFTEEERANPMELYDILESNDIFNLVISKIDESGEYAILTAFLEDVKNNNINFKYSAAGIIQTLIQDLPKNAAVAAEIVEKFDPEKFEQVKNFAEAANGNRPIPITKV